MPTLYRLGEPKVLTGKRKIKLENKKQQLEERKFKTECNSVYILNNSPVGCTVSSHILKKLYQSAGRSITLFTKAKTSYRDRGFINDFRKSSI